MLRSLQRQRRPRSVFSGILNHEAAIGPLLLGEGLEQRISRIGSDLELDIGIGTCGKDGQGVPVGVGMPTIRIDGITVGGTQG